MEINGLDGGTAAAIFPGEEKNNAELGREEFLNLLVTKLANQDPLEPTGDTEFIAQLAQFSELEQSIQMNDNLLSLADGQSSLINAQALDLIGRDVLIDSLQMRITDGEPDNLVLNLGEGIASGEIRIFDSSGKQVHSIPLNANPTGRHEIEWDGTAAVPGADGEEGETIKLADGDYTFEVSASNSNGETAQARLLVSASIEGINFTAGIPVLVSAGREVPFDEIVEIRASAGDLLAQVEED